MLQLLTLAAVFLFSGATCTGRRALPEFAPPVVFEAPPTLPELIEQVNRKLQIRSLSSNDLRITSPEMPASLTGTMRWVRPNKFSLKAYPFSKAMGVAFIAGSNDEMFWLQQQIPSPPTFYSARHDEFENQLVQRQVLPVSPLWIRQALGVVELDPYGQHSGPVMRQDGLIEIQTTIPSPRGDYRQVLVLEPRTVTLRQISLIDSENVTIATAIQSEHQYYGVINTNLPHKVDIQLRPRGGVPIVFTVEVGNYLLNSEDGSGVAFEPPDATGLTQVDLVRFNEAFAARSGFPGSSSQVPPPSPGLPNIGTSHPGMYQPGGQMYPPMQGDPSQQFPVQPPAYTPARTSAAPRSLFGDFIKR